MCFLGGGVHRWAVWGAVQVEVTPGLWPEQLEAGDLSAAVTRELASSCTHVHRVLGLCPEWDRRVIGHTPLPFQRAPGAIVCSSFFLLFISWEFLCQYMLVYLILTNDAMACLPKLPLIPFWLVPVCYCFQQCSTGYLYLFAYLCAYL